MGDEIFQTWIRRWALEPDGDFFSTHSSDLLPVRQGGARAILKVARGAEERRGGAIMAWWGGEGAAPVLAHDEVAVLLQRAEGPGDLAVLARNDDAGAARILCDAAARLHVHASRAPPREAIPIRLWFRALGPGAEAHGGVLDKASEVARELLDDPRDLVLLHGDLHHGNVLDFGPLGWLAIDPKGVLGERTYDYVQMLCNPDAATATRPGRLQALAPVVARAAGLELERLLRWTLAYAGLSASWTLANGRDASPALAIAGIAAGELGL